MRALVTISGWAATRDIGGIVGEENGARNLPANALQRNMRIDGRRPGRADRAAGGVIPPVRC
jgi:hypothetical protein